MNKIKELHKTEISYIKDLKEIDKYLSFLEEPRGRNIPEDLLRHGKFRIVFGNIRDLIDFHQSIVLPQFERSLDDVTILASLFIGRKDDFNKKYCKFCLNHPMSEYILNQYEPFFKVSDKYLI